MMEQANRILTVLEEAGYEAYIIGGAVRDILMHQKPHDFDIVTSAVPIRSLMFSAVMIFKPQTLWANPLVLWWQH